MLNHHIQKSIIYRLALASPLRFSELKPDELDNKLFNYHLKIVNNLGLVTKDDSGLYILTPKGKTLGVHVYSEVEDTFKRARSVLLLAIRKDDQWLMYRRNNQPLKGLVGFMHCEPEATITLIDKASQYLKKTCGLEANFKVVGSGISSAVIDNKIENYINFSVLLTSDPKGELNVNNELADYFWVSENKVAEYKLLPSMNEILEGIAGNKLFFIDQTYHL